MSLDTLTAPAALSGAGGRVRLALVAIGLGAVALMLLFREEVAAMVGVWSTSTAYNHCFLVIPLAAYMAWDRRTSLIGAVPAPWPRAVILAIPLGIAWLAAERLGIMEGRQLVAVAFLELLFLAVLGRQMFGMLAGPLLYLFFLVPFGAFLTSSLQDFTTSFVVHGLDLLGVPNYSDGNTIEIPEGVFLVAEACAGLRFLIASVAFGCLYAILLYRSPIRRLAFIAASMVVPVIANGFRALGIVMLGHLMGSAQAVEADHVLYGWVFFSVVILLLILVGLPFREDSRQIAPAATASRRRLPPSGGAAGIGALRFLPVATAAGVVVLAALGPAAAARLDAAAQADEAAPSVALRADAGCEAGAAQTDPNFATKAVPGLLSVSVQRFTCADRAFDVRIARLSPLATPAAILRVQRAMTGEDEASDVAAHWLEGHVWQLVQTTEPTRTTLSGLWIEGRPMAPGLRMRLRQALGTVTGNRSMPVLVAIAPAKEDALGQAGEGPHATADRLGGFISSQGTLMDQIAGLAGGS